MEAEAIMGSDQELLRDLCCGRHAAIEPKLVAAEAGISVNGLYNLWNQHGRIVPSRVFRACLRVARRLHQANPAALHQIAMVIGEEVGIEDGMAIVFPAGEQQLNPINLCYWTGDLLQSQGDLIKAIAQIMADGRINADDGAYVAKYRHSARVLINALLNLESALVREVVLVGGEARP